MKAVVFISESKGLLITATSSSYFFQLEPFFFLASDKAIRIQYFPISSPNKLLTMMINIKQLMEHFNFLIKKIV